MICVQRSFVGIVGTLSLFDLVIGEEWGRNNSQPEQQHQRGNRQLHQLIKYYIQFTINHVYKQNYISQNQLSNYILFAINFDFDKKYNNFVWQQLLYFIDLNQYQSQQCNYLRYHRFGGMSQSISGKLFQKLNQQEITPQQLFSIPNINGDIRQNIQKFLAFCARKRNFTVQMFELCFNSKYQQLNNENKKKVAQYTIEGLSNDEDVLAQFLFNTPHSLQNSSIVSEKIEEETDNIQTQAQRLFGDDSPRSDKNQWEKQPQVFEKYELAKLVLDHLKQEQKNQTCLGYIHKVYSSILRREGKYVLQFFKQNQDYLDLLLENIKFPSISNIVALILSSQDKSGQYQYEYLKASIFSKLLDYAFKNIQNVQRFQGFMLTAQEILNSTKQSYYEYFDDFKRCANVLVSQQTLNKFLTQLKSRNVNKFSNAISYLDLIMRRINTQNDDNDYYRQDNSEPTMKFEYSFLFKEDQTLTQLLKYCESHKPLVRLNFLCFLLNLLKVKKNNEGLSKLELFKNIFRSHLDEKKTGIVKNYLYQILETILKKCSQNQIEQISNWLISSKLIDNQIKTRFGLSNNAVNNDLVSCFLLSLLFQIQNKNKGFLNKTNSEIRNNLRQTNQIFKTKLAEQIHDNIFQMQFVIPKKFQQLQKNDQINVQKQAQKQTHVGRNNILIPSLNLPNKNQNVKVLIQEETVQQFELPQQPTRQSIINDLKNTIIQLPQKFRQKNKINEEKIQDNKNPQVKEKKEQIKKATDLEEQDQSFYIRHLMLF